MKVSYIGQEGDPEQSTHFGIPFTRGGDAVEVPDDHPNAASFVNNRFFKVTGRAADKLRDKEADRDHTLDDLRQPPAQPATADPFISLDPTSGNPAPASDRMNPSAE